jgi:WD40 repeat protein
MALSPDGGTLIACGRDQALCLIDVKTGKEFGDATRNTEPVLTIGFADNGNQLLTECFEGIMKKWEVETGKFLGMISRPAVPALTVAGPGGQMFAAQYLPNMPLKTPSRKPNDRIAFIQAATGKEIGSYNPKLKSEHGPGPFPEQHANVVFSPAGHILAIRWPDDRRIDVCEAPTGKLLRSFSIDTGAPSAAIDDNGVPPESMVFSADGKLLAAFGAANTISVWDTDTGTRVSTFKTPSGRLISSGAFSLDNRCLALDMNDGSVNFYELASGKLRQVFGIPVQLPEYARPNYFAVRRHSPRGQQMGSRVAFSPDGKLLAHAGLDRKVHVWDAFTGNEVAAFQGHLGPLSAIAFSPDGTKLASSSADSTALIWALKRLPR